MKQYRNSRLSVSLLLVVLIAALAIAVIDMSPEPALAKGPCDVAAEYGGHSTFWNMLCFVEMLFDYMFLYGDLY